MMSERKKLERELRKADIMISQAVDMQMEADYQYESWRKEKTNILSVISKLPEQVKDK
jgi:hypothetical protein